MTVKAGLKAGAIGAVVVVILNLLTLIPVPMLGCVCCGITLLVYPAIGVLAARFLESPHDTGAAAGAGAIAGLIAGTLGGIVWAILTVVGAQSAQTADMFSMLDPDMMRQLYDMGIDPETLAAMSGGVGSVIAGGFCCLGTAIIGAGLGALGGVLGGQTKKQAV